MSSAHNVCDYEAVVEIFHAVEGYSTAHGGIDTDATLVLDHLLIVVLVDGSEQHKLSFSLVAVGIFRQRFNILAFSELVHDMQSIVKVGPSTNVTSAIVLSPQPSDDDI